MDPNTSIFGEILILIAAVVFWVIGKFVNPIYLLIANLLLGLFTIFVIFFHSLKNIEVPYILDIKDQMKYQKYYEYKSWLKSKQPLKFIARLFLFIAITWVVVTILLVGVEKTTDNLPPNLEIIRSTLHQSVLNILIFVLIVIYILFIYMILARKIPVEVKLLVANASERKIIGLGLLFFLFASIYGLIASYVPFQSILLALIILPLFILMARIEGKYFFLFALNQLSISTRWDMMRGRRVWTPDDPILVRFFGRFQQVIGLVAIASLPIGLLAGILRIADYFLGYIKVGKSIVDDVLGQFFSNDLYVIAVLLLTSGSLLVLFIRPFGFVTTYLNQGLYDKVASDWSLKSSNQFIDRYHHIIYTPVLSRGFNASVLFSTLVMLLTFNLNFIPGLIPEPWHYEIAGALLLGQIVFTVVLVLSVGYLAVDWIEEKTVWLFSRSSNKYSASKNEDIDLINRSIFLFGLLTVNSAPVEDKEAYLTSLRDNFPEDWGILPFALAISKTVGTNDENIEWYRESLAERLPKAIIPTVWYNLGVLLYDKRKLVQAEEAYKKAITIKPSYAEAYYNLGVLLYHEERVRESEKSFRKTIQLDPTNAHAWYNLGLLLEDQKKYLESEKAYRETVRLQADNANAWYNLALLLDDLDKTAESEQALRESIRLQPNYAEAWNNLGVILYEQHKYEEAEQAYREALRLKNDYAGVWNNLGVLLEELKRIPEAEAALRQTIELQAEYEVAWNNLGVLLKNQGKYSEAERDFRESIRINPDYDVAWNNLGLVLHDLHRPEESEEAYKAALKLDPKYTKVWYNLALLLDEQDRFEEAITAYNKFLELISSEFEKRYITYAKKRINHLRKKIRE